MGDVMPEVASLIMASLFIGYMIKRDREFTKALSQRDKSLKAFSVVLDGMLECMRKLLRDQRTIRDRGVRRRRRKRRPLADAGEDSDDASSG